MPHYLACYCILIRFLPGGVVYQRQFAEVVPLLKRGHRTLSVNHDVHRALEKDVPGPALVPLIEHWKEEVCGNFN